MSYSTGGEVRLIVLVGGVSYSTGGEVRLIVLVGRCVL